MRVLFVAAEAAPFIKTGGLGDVIGSLPQALQQQGVDIAVMLPKYKQIPQTYRDQMEHLCEIEIQLGWRTQYCGIEVLKHDGILFYFIDNEYYFARDGIYGYMDEDGERYAYFNRAVLEAIRALNFQADIIHCHDWHTAMIPLLLKAHYGDDPFFHSTKTVFTIHNLLYQGTFSYDILGDLLGLDNQHYLGVEYYGNANFMKSGIEFSDHVTTVSPTYANEIKTSQYGYGLNGVLSSLGNKLTGIVNGIDTLSYNPANDPYIYSNFTTNLDDKLENKIALQKELNLPIAPKIPLIAMVTRLVDSKGLELVIRILDEMLYYDDVQFVVLGTGDPYYERWFREASQRYPLKCASQITFNEGLSRKFYAASDLFLMPSKFEPCGISQLLALQYGSIPIVRETGGLNDTIHSYNEYTGEGNGFTFNAYNAHDMMHTIRRAVSFYHQKEAWDQIVKNAFAGDYSWGVSAQEYIEIYDHVLG
ncbi:glycogen synthase GlgA [Paenibacillus sp. CMAA1364]